MLPKNAVVNSYAGNHTLDASDAGAYVRITAAGIVTLPDGMPTNYQCVIVNATDDDVVELAAETTLTIPSGMTAEVANHRAVTVIHVGSDVWEAHGALPEQPFTTVTTGRTLTAADANRVLVCDGTFTLTVPDLGGGVQVGIVNVGTGIVTVEADTGVTMNVDPVLLDNTDVAVTFVTLLELTAGDWAAIVTPRPQTYTVIYDAGWPASRPDADHVHAIGHTSAPSWLTADDVWFEDVS